LSLPGRADKTSARLDASVRTTRFCRPRQHLSSACFAIAHRSFDPPCDPIARKTLPRPPHPAPYVRDDRDTPPLSGRDANSSRDDLGCPKTEIILRMGLDWWNQIDPVQQIRPCAQLRDLSRAALEVTATDRGVGVRVFCATKRQMSGSARRFRPRFRPCRIRTRDLTSPPFVLKF
jgi:hypothetical protein